MAHNKVAQLERISQQINFQIQNVNHLMAQAGFEMELTHHLMKTMGETFNGLKTIFLKDLQSIVKNSKKVHTLTYIF